MCDKVIKARENAIASEVEALARRSARVEAAIALVERTTDPRYQDAAIRGIVDTFYFRRHALARGADRNVSGQRYDATGKRLRPADAIRTRGPGKRTGLGADRKRASADLQARTWHGVHVLRECARIAQIPGTPGRRAALDTLRAAAHRRGVPLDSLLASL